MRNKRAYFIHNNEVIKALSNNVRGYFQTCGDNCTLSASEAGLRGPDSGLGKKSNRNYAHTQTFTLVIFAKCTVTFINKLLFGTICFLYAV